MPPRLTAVRNCWMGRAIWRWTSAVAASITSSAARMTSSSRSYRVLAAVRATLRSRPAYTLQPRPGTSASANSRTVPPRSGRSGALALRKNAVRTIESPTNCGSVVPASSSLPFGEVTM